MTQIETVAVDVALLVAFCVALDEKYDDGSFSEFLKDALE
jgi:hypothetical protein